MSHTGWTTDEEEDPEPEPEANKFVDYEVTFNPPNFIEDTIPQIVGDMTGYMPINMNPVDGEEGRFTFNFKKLLKGWKYRFWFIY